MRLGSSRYVEESLSNIMNGRTTNAGDEKL
jgi:hypothetical protein